jgi:hypothetical protein
MTQPAEPFATRREFDLPAHQNLDTTGTRGVAVVLLNGAIRDTVEQTTGRLKTDVARVANHERTHEQDTRDRAGGGWPASALPV